MKSLERIGWLQNYNVLDGALVVMNVVLPRQLLAARLAIPEQLEQGQLCKN